MQKRLALIVGWFTVFTAACAGPSAQVSTGRSAEAEQSRALAIAVTGELSSLAPKLPSTGGGSSNPRRLFNAALSLTDGAGAIRPYLAHALPQLNTETWRVFPDGKMETNYPLRAGLTWQDGTPLTAQDFAFAFRMYQTPGLGFSSRPEDLMEAVLAPDPSTVIIRWRSVYARAGALGMGELNPLPRHILEAPFDAYERGAATPETLLGDPFWTLEYVGAGPYRITEWVPGSQLSGEAFDGHALGRPKIGRVLVRIFNDENTVLAAVLAGGQVEYTNRFALRFEHVPTLRREWESQGKGIVGLLNSPAIRLDVQHRPEHVGDPALLDVRVRRAIAHTLDRVALNDGLFDGLGVPTESFVPHTEPMYVELDRLLSKYPFDRRRAEQLMSEARFALDHGGLFADSTGRRFRLDFRVSAGLEIERTQAILSDAWRRAGFDVGTDVLSLAERRDPASRHTFLGLSSGGGGPSERSFATEEIGTPANRWSGANRGGWSNADYDRLFSTFISTLEIDQAQRLSVQMMALVSESVAAYPLYSPIHVETWVANLQGPEMGTTGFGLLSSATTPYWNVYDWKLRS